MIVYLRRYQSMMQTEGGRGIKGRLSIRDAGLPFVLPQNSRDYLKRVRRVWIEFTMRHWINPFSPSRLQYLDHYEKKWPFRPYARSSCIFLRFKTDCSHSQMQSTFVSFYNPRRHPQVLPYGSKINAFRTVRLDSHYQPTGGSFILPDA